MSADQARLPAFGDGGWFWLSKEGEEASRKIYEAMQQDADIVVKAYQAVFTSGPGRIVLADLMGRTLNQPTWVTGVPDPVMAGCQREGQNSITRYILDKLASGGLAETFTPQPDFSGVTEHGKEQHDGDGNAEQSAEPERQPAGEPDGPERRRRDAGVPTAGDRPQRKRRKRGGLASILDGSHTPGTEERPERPKGGKRKR